MPTKGIMKACANVPFDILVASFTNIPVGVPKHMILHASGNSTVNIIDREQVDKERHHAIGTVQATSKSPVQIDEIYITPNTNNDWRNTISIPP